MPNFGRIIVIKRDGTDGPFFPVVNKSTTLGRSGECDIRIQLPNVSLFHCNVHIADDSHAFLQNKSSVNVSYVDGKEVLSNEILHHKSIFKISDRHFRFEYPVVSKWATAAPVNKRLSVLRKSIGPKRKSLSASATPKRKPLWSDIARKAAPLPTPPRTLIQKKPLLIKKAKSNKDFSKTTNHEYQPYKFSDESVTGHANSPATIIISKSQNIRRKSIKPVQIKEASIKTSTKNSKILNSSNGSISKRKSLIVTSSLSKDHTSRRNTINPFSKEKKSVGPKSILHNSSRRSLGIKRTASSEFDISSKRKSVSAAINTSLLTNENSTHSSRRKSVRFSLHNSKLHTSSPNISKSTNRKSIGLTGVSKLFNLPKEQSTPIYKGLRELFQSKASPVSPDLTGLANIFKERFGEHTSEKLQCYRGIYDSESDFGLRKLFKESKRRKSVDYAGLKELFSVDDAENCSPNKEQTSKRHSVEKSEISPNNPLVDYILDIIAENDIPVDKQPVHTASLMENAKQSQSRSSLGVKNQHSINEPPNKDMPVKQSNTDSPLLLLTTKSKGKSNSLVDKTNISTQPNNKTSHVSEDNESHENLSKEIESFNERENRVIRPEIEEPPIKIAENVKRSRKYVDKEESVDNLEFEKPRTRSKRNVTKVKSKAKIDSNEANTTIESKELQEIATDECARETRSRSAKKMVKNTTIEKPKKRNRNATMEDDSGTEASRSKIAPTEKNTVAITDEKLITIEKRTQSRKNVKNANEFDIVEKPRTRSKRNVPVIDNNVEYAEKPKTRSKRLSPSECQDQDNSSKKAKRTKKQVANTESQIEINNHKPKPESKKRNQKVDTISPSETKDNQTTTVSEISTESNQPSITFEKPKRGKRNVTKHVENTIVKADELPSVNSDHFEIRKSKRVRVKTPSVISNYENIETNSEMGSKQNRKRSLENIQNAEEMTSDSKSKHLETESINEHVKSKRSRDRNKAKSKLEESVEDLQIRPNTRSTRKISKDATVGVNAKSKRSNKKDKQNDEKRKLSVIPEEIEVVEVAKRVTRSRKAKAI